MKDINKYHKTLQRQIKKAMPEAKEYSQELLRLFEMVSESYKHSDEDRELIDRSLDLSSKELTGINERLQKEVNQTSEKAKELEKLNDLMINRELKMIELKKQLEQFNDKSTEK